MKTLTSAVLLTLTGAFVSPAQAAFFNNASGLVGPQQTVDFESVVLIQNFSVTNQFQSLGVTFDNAFGNPDTSNLYPNITSNRIGNFFPNAQASLMTINFTTDLSQVAFAMVTAPGHSTFQAFLNGSLVESSGAIATTTTNSTNFYGFRDIVFDQIQVSVVSSDNALLMDNLQTVSVPAPGSWALLLSGAMALVGVAARRDAKPV